MRRWGAQMYDEPVRISVIIGFKDWGLDRLSGAVKSIQRSLGNIPSEVIIADYGSTTTEGYQNELENLGAIYRYVPTDGTWSRSRALNAGLQIAQGKYLVTTDADMVFSPSSFPRILELLENDPKTSYILQCRDLPEGISHDDILEKEIDWDWLDSRSRLRPRWGMGGMIAFDRDAYEALRGLDERMQIYGGEDIDLAKRLLRLGYKRLWINDPTVRMYHVWHPSSRASADETSEGRVAIKTNRDIHLNDKSRVRNLREWKGRPQSANPLVTVAVSTFNRAEYLEDSINSVIGQTFEDWELLIVNDGSTDDTLDVLAQFNDPRIRVITQENRGLAAARNRITSEARGRFIAVHDDDDIMLPWSLEVRLQAITEGAHGSYGGWIDYDNSTGERKYNIGKKLSIESLLFNRATYLHPTLLVETRVMKAIPYNETMRSGSDFNLAVRMIRSGIKLNHSTHYVLLRRLHDGQITNADSTLQKVSGALTNFMARGTMTPSDVAEMRQGRHEKDKAVIAVGAVDAEPYIIPFMPDHLVCREVGLSHEVYATEISDIDSDLPVKSFWRCGETQTIEIEADYGEVSLNRLFELYKKHSKYLTIRAVENESEDPQGVVGSRESIASTVAEPAITVEDWLVERLNTSPAGIYVALQSSFMQAGQLIDLSNAREVDDPASERPLIGFREGYRVFRVKSLSDVASVLQQESRAGISPHHLIMEKEV